jgi:hypothetical protein
VPVCAADSLGVEAAGPGAGAGDVPQLPRAARVPAGTGGFILPYLVAFHTRQGHETFFDAVRAEWPRVSELLAGAPELASMALQHFFVDPRSLPRSARAAAFTRSSSLSKAPTTRSSPSACFSSLALVLCCAEWRLFLREQRHWPVRDRSRKSGRSSVHRPRAGIIPELCWSDPIVVLPMFPPASRGCSDIFGREGIDYFLVPTEP